MRIKGTLMLGLATGLLAAAAARAADGIETVVVTAEKRTERIQDLPIAISAYGGATLKSAGVTNVRDLQAIAPSLDIGSKGSETFITIRGIGSEIASIGSEPGVTVSQDGVVLASHLFFNADFLDVARVEVLRGPQGTISGRNATGGAINIISEQPTDDFHAELTAIGGNYDRYASEGYVSGPLLDGALLGRIAFSIDNRDGWLKDLANGQRLGSRDEQHGRVSLVTHFGGAVTVQLIVEGLSDHSLPQTTSSIGRARPDVPSLGEQFGVPDLDLDTLTFSADQKRIYSREQYGVGLKLTWQIAPRTSLTSTSGYWKTDIQDAQDTDGTLVSLGDFPFWDWHIHQTSQELTLASDLTDNLDLILGGLYLSESAAQPLEFVAGVLGITPGSYVVFPVQNLTSYAGYGQLRYQLTDQIRLSAGLRYTHDAKSYFESGFIFAPIAGGGADSWDAMTPRFAIDYKPSDDITLFANVARGFKAGGFNTLDFAPVNAFKPEFVWSYETGIKASLLEDRLSLAASGFKMDYSNLQETVYAPGPGGVPVADVENVPSASIKGIELELNGRPLDGLTLGLTGSWLDATVNRFVTIDPLYPELGVQDFAGNRLARAPAWQVALSGEYTFPLGSAFSATLRADYGWRSHQFFELFNHPLEAQGAYGLLNLRAAIDDASGHWEVAAFGENVTDERYLDNAFASVIIPGVPMNLASIGEPATWGASVSYRF